MKKIPLTQGQYALVDDEDYEWLNQWKWYAMFNVHTKSFYAVRRKKNKTKKPRQIAEWMHREIIKTPEGLVTDHINHNTLDNRKRNLRSCTVEQNCQNKKLQNNNTSGCSGVCWSIQHNKWMSYMSIKGKRKHLGIFKTKSEAIKCSTEARKKTNGDFAYLTNNLCS